MTTDWTKLDMDGLDIPRKGEVYCLAKGRKQVRVLSAETDVLYQVLLDQDGRKLWKPTFESCSATRFVAEYKSSPKRQNRIMLGTVEENEYG